LQGSLVFLLFLPWLGGCLWGQKVTEADEVKGAELQPLGRHLWPQGRVVKKGRWSDVASRCFATLVFAPAMAREPDAKVRSRVLPLLCVGVSISEMNTNPYLSSHSDTVPAEAEGSCWSEGCHLLCNRLKSPASVFSYLESEQ
jgi:hypothetical protein